MEKKEIIAISFLAVACKNNTFQGAENTSEHTEIPWVFKTKINLYFCSSLTTCYLYFLISFSPLSLSNFIAHPYFYLSYTNQFNLKKKKKRNKAFINIFCQIFTCVFFFFLKRILMSCNFHSYSARKICITKSFISIHPSYIKHMHRVGTEKFFAQTRMIVENLMLFILLEPPS